MHWLHWLLPQTLTARPTWANCMSGLTLPRLCRGTSSHSTMHPATLAFSRPASVQDGQCGLAHGRWLSTWDSSGRDSWEYGCSPSTSRCTSIVTWRSDTHLPVCLLCAVLRIGTVRVGFGECLAAEVRGSCARLLLRYPSLPAVSVDGGMVGAVVMVYLV